MGWLYKKGVNRSAWFFWKYTCGPLFTAGKNELALAHRTSSMS